MPRKPRIVWKVVREDFYGGFYPAIAPVSMEYRMGEKAIPYFTGSVIYAFDTMTNAVSFVSSYMRSRLGVILKCTAQPSLRWKHPIMSVLTSFSSLRDFWDLSEVRRRTAEGAPHGTVMCLWVMPLTAYRCSDISRADDIHSWRRYK